MSLLSRADKSVSHELTQAFRHGQDTPDFIQKLWTARCSCGFVSTEGSFTQMQMQLGAHTAAVQAAEQQAAEGPLAVGLSLVGS